MPVLARSSRSASLKLGGGDGEIARIVERAVDGRVGLGGPEVGGRGRKCVDIVAINNCGVVDEDAGGCCEDTDGTQKNDMQGKADQRGSPNLLPPRMERQTRYSEEAKVSVNK